ncbi:MAG: hypothetical protein H7256_12455 [Bdellovibrio sp.]|nr:hypothetical protein [Bdellovibrio sp.]
MKNLDQRIVFLFSGRIVQAFLTVFTIRIMTGTLPAVEIGNQYIINSIYLWFSMVLINPVGMFVSRHLNEWKNDRKIYYILNGMNSYFVLVALISIPSVVLAKYFFNVLYLNSYGEVIILVSALIYISTWFALLNSFFNLLEFQKTFVVLNSLSQVTGLVVSYVIVRFLRTDALGWLSGILLGQLLGLVVGIWLFRRFVPHDDAENKPRQELFFTREAFAFCHPVAITTLFMWFLNQGYRFIVEKNLGLETLASVAIGLGLATSTVGLIELVTTQYFYPKYYASLLNSTLEQRRAAWEILWKKSVIIYIVGTCAILSMSHFIIEILVAPEFRNIILYLVVGIGIEFFKINSNILYLVAHGEKKTTRTIIPYFTGAVLLILFFIGLYYFRELSVNYVLYALMAAHLATYISNLHQVKKMISPSYDKLIIFKSVLAGLPLVIAFVFLQGAPFVVLFGAAAASGLWCLGCIYYLVGELEVNI